MWSAYYDSNPARVLSTRILGTFSRRAYYGPLAPFRARTVARSALPGRRWVRVRNALAGVSEDDLSLIHLAASSRVSLMAAPRRSRIFLGREVVGEVAEIGPEVEFLRIGDRVAYQTDQCCATEQVEPPCAQCAAGNYSLCENRYLPGPEALGAGWSDEMILHERQLFLVPDQLTDEQAALIAPIASALHAILRYQPPPGGHALVIGGGTSGLLLIQALKALQPNSAITVQPTHGFQVGFATQSGVTNILESEDSSAAAARVTGAKHFKTRLGAELLVGGFDVVYDSIGSANSLQHALRWAREGGTVVLVGRRLAPVDADLTPLWHREITLAGVQAHGTENWPGGLGPSGWGVDGGRVSSFALAAAMLRDRRIAPERLITHRFPLREVRRAVATAQDTATHRAIKVVLDMRPMSAYAPEGNQSVAQEVTG
jgi:threonine dehydrogenase-like Zn-dependent dehydrogenase